MAGRAVNDTVRLLAQLGEQVFVPCFVRPSRKRFPGYLDDWVEALKLFLDGYAFERQGRSPAYSELAVMAVAKSSSFHDYQFSAERLAPKVWKAFCDLGQFGDGPGANPKNNPLWPGHDEDQSRGVVSTALSRYLDDDDHNLYSFARRSIGSNQLRKAHTTLQRIRGIGPKIASLFLRDVALYNNLSDINLQERWLLQPIDTWLRRTVQNLSTTKPRSDEEAAQAITSLADEAGCCALFLNAGSWYFGSQIARTPQNLNNMVGNLGSVRDSLEEYRGRLLHEASCLNRFDRDGAASVPLDGLGGVCGSEV